MLFMSEKQEQKMLFIFIDGKSLETIDEVFLEVPCTCHSITDDIPGKSFEVNLKWDQIAPIVYTGENSN